MTTGCLRLAEMPKVEAVIVFLTTSGGAWASRPSAWRLLP
jgi:hypothetical protein